MIPITWHSSKSQDCRDSNRISCQGSGGGGRRDEQVEHRGCLGQWTILCDTVMVGTGHYVFVETHTAVPRGNHNVNYKLELIITYRHWFINSSKCTPLMQDVNNCGTVVGGWGMWGCFVQLAQFRKPKTAQNDEVYLFKKTGLIEGCFQLSQSYRERK